MASQEARATANLKRLASLSSKKMMANINKAIADVDALIAENVKQNPYGWLDAGRENAYGAIDKRFKELRVALDNALGQLALKAAKSGNKAAIDQSKGAITQFSEEHLRAYLERITPKNAPSLAAVYTSSMSSSAKAALRETALSVFTSAAATGMTMAEQARQFQHEWALRSKDANPYRFIDKSGRAWENARYIQMLTRTTAQRVETAAFCDSMLADGFPLARISNDTDHDCGVCSEWEGRLIDLSAGHQLGSGTYTLQEAREAGLFHPNCLHRLEYVSISEIPKSLWPKVKDKIGVPGAFGDNKTATKPDLQTNAERKKHVKQVESAAEEKAKEVLSPEAVREALDRKNVKLSASLADIDTDLLEENLAYLNDLLNRFPSIAREIDTYGLKVEARAWKSNDVAYVASEFYSPKMTLCLSKNHYKYYGKVTIETGEQALLGNWMPCAKEKRTIYTVAHEFGHIVQNVLIWKHIKANEAEYKEALAHDMISKKPTAVEQFRTRVARTHKEELFKIVKEERPRMTKKAFENSMSRYGSKKESDFFAEAFANAECGKPNVIGKAMTTFLERNV